MTEVPRQSLAGRYGFKPGDLISQINGVEIGDVDVLAAVLDQGASFWRFEIIRDGRRIRQIIR
jgi:S1-C subfamily serine protease